MVRIVRGERAGASLAKDGDENDRFDEGRTKAAL